MIKRDKESEEEDSVWDIVDPDGVLNENIDFYSSLSFSIPPIKKTISSLSIDVDERLPMTVSDLVCTNLRANQDFKAIELNSNLVFKQNIIRRKDANTFYTTHEQQKLSRSKSLHNILNSTFDLNYNTNTAIRSKSSSFVNLTVINNNDECSEKDSKIISNILFLPLLFSHLFIFTLGIGFGRTLIKLKQKS